jgi:hypothetical protein
MANRIHVEYSEDSLADIDPGWFEAALEDRLRQCYPGADISVREGIGNRYRLDGEDSEELRQVANDVFNRMCEGAADAD